jgi:hypothetical protein
MGSPWVRWYRGFGGSARVQAPAHVERVALPVLEHLDEVAAEVGAQRGRPGDPPQVAGSGQPHVPGVVERANPAGAGLRPARLTGARRPAIPRTAWFRGRRAARRPALRRDPSTRVWAACRDELLVTSTTTLQPSSAAPSPSPVVRSTRYSAELRLSTRTPCPRDRSSSATRRPSVPVPPAIAILMPTRRGTRPARDTRPGRP